MSYEPGLPGDPAGTPSAAPPFGPSFAPWSAPSWALSWAPSLAGARALTLQGRVGGPELVALGTMLDAAVSEATGQVTVDVSAVDSWSLLAQAMVLNTARLLASQDRRLVLLDPSPALREQSERLQVFARVVTEQGPAT